jgi:hypothetical protein
MDLSATNIHVQARIHQYAPDHTVVELLVFERGLDGKLYPLPGGLVCDIGCAPKLLGGLNWAVKTARAEGYLKDKVPCRSKRREQPTPTCEPVVAQANEQLHRERTKLVSLLRHRARSGIAPGKFHNRQH